MADGKVTISTALDNKGFEKGVAEAKQVLGKISGALGGLAKVTAGVTAGIVAAFGTAAVAITKQSVDAYADYQQLMGGVTTLFKDGADEVVSYAEDAFYRAGVSANKYMETVTSFSASLISALGGDTVKAAQVADMAMVDMADNANKMGTAVENIQNAYQGFAKGQYLLLDNLKLGYDGTKTEMERLLKDAQAITGVKYDINNLADVYSAIHAIQEKLGIAGATAEEAEKTISGSAAMTKAAWENVLAAIAGGGDLDKAINNLVFSVSKYFQNIVPVVERALSGIGKLIEQVAPMLVQTVAVALIKAIPSLLNAVYQMIIGLANGIYQGIVALFTGESREIEAQIENDASSALGAVTEGYKDAEEAAKDAEKAAKRYLAGFDEIQRIGGNAKDSTDDGTLAGSAVGSGIGSGIISGGDASEAAGGIEKVFDAAQIGRKIATCFNSIVSALNSGLESIDFLGIGQTIGQGLTAVAEEVDWGVLGRFAANTLTMLPETLIGIVTGTDWGAVTQGLSELLVSTMDGCTQWIQDTDWEEVGDQTADALVGAWEGIDWVSISESFGELLGSAIKGLGEFLWGAIDEAVASIDEYFAEKVDEAGGNIALGWFNGIIEGLGDIGKWIWDNIFSPFIDGFKSAFGIHSPSTVMEEQGDFLIQGLLGGISKTWEDVTKFFDDALADLEEAMDALGEDLAGWASGAWEGIKEVFGDVGKWFEETFSDAWEGIVDVFSDAGEIFTDIKDGVVSSFKSIVNKLIDGINSVVATPFNGINDALKLVKDINIFGVTPFSGLKTISVPQIPHLAQGAVLPANKPFLAMVGDQKHGTNVEAPLATIQEAVANVMADMLPAMMAGFEAVVAEQRAIHSTMKGIEIGDSTIGRAVERYNRQMSVIRGSV